MVCLALLFASQATAATAPEVARVISPGSYSCPTESEWERTLAGYGLTSSTNGLAWVDENRAAFAPWVCDAIERKGNRLGAALNVVAHEAAHLRGVRSEAEAACWGLLWAADLAQRFYGIEFYSLDSQTVIARSVAYHRSYPMEYRVVCG